MFGLLFQLERVQDSLSALIIWAQVGQVKGKTDNGKGKPFRVLRKYSEWHSVMEVWTLFSNARAVGPYTAQCFWDWACTGAGQSERGTWKRIN